MKKRTSKSASETPKASSPSGTSAKTVATESQPASKYPGKFGFVLEKVLKMTPEEGLRSMIQAGIYTEDGELTPHYQRGAKAKAKKKSAKA